ncbi:iron-sulfur cluster assembly scaffold protein [Leptospira ryugenii]|uniref:iron-sulfur cluster assembly scaffold protein n=1 Tax=Leptospira ryugenii TaxID=1917863 RepID=UPI000D598FD7|nr:iron-sulfur cluster assembly scaffold protein [Leptospira ryugenii]
MSQENKSDIELFLHWKGLGKWSHKPESQFTISVHNPLCGDELHLDFSQVEGGFLIESMSGESCSVCQASSGLLFHKKLVWSKEEAERQKSVYSEYLEGLLNDIPLDEKPFWDILKTKPGRHRCALLPYQALIKFFSG